MISNNLKYKLKNIYQLCMNKILLEKNHVFQLSLNHKLFLHIAIETELKRPKDDFPKINHIIKMTVGETTDNDYKVLRVPSYIQKNIAKKDFIFS